MNAIPKIPVVEQDQEVPHPAVAAALERILADPDFARNVNSARFLKFVVEETVAGRGGRLKAFTIATLALQRPADFNPQANSIVRVQARRLRELLEVYYCGAGSADPVVITLPLGSYQPHFAWRFGPPEPVAAAQPAGASEPAKPTPAPQPPVARSLSYALFVAFSLIAVLATVYLATLAFQPYWRAPVADESGGLPTVAVAPAELAGDDASLSAAPLELLDQIETGLAEYDYLSVRHSGRSSRASQSDYVVVGRFSRGADAEWTAEVRLQRGMNGDVIWARRFDKLGGADKAAVVAAANAAIVGIGDVGLGAILVDARARLSHAREPLAGYACLLAAYEYMRDRMPTQFAPSLACVRAAAESDPLNYRAMSLLSRLLVVAYLAEPDTAKASALLREADTFSRRAGDLAPQRAEVQEALFEASFYNKRYEEAFDFGRRALSINPHASLIAVNVAKAYCAREHYNDAVALLEPLQNIAVGEWTSGHATLSIAMHFLGEKERAYQLAAKLPGAEVSPLGLMMRIVTSYEHGEALEASQAAAKLRTNFPAFASDIDGALARRGISERARAGLLADLRAAGWNSAALN